MSPSPPLPPAPPWVVPVISVAFALIWIALLLWFLRARREDKRPTAAALCFDATGTVWCSGSDGRANRVRQCGLLTFRCCVLGFYAYVLAVLYSPGHYSWVNFLFYTVQNFHLQALWWTLAASLSLRVLLCPPRGAPRQCGAETHAHAVSMLFEVCLPLALLVSIVEWGILAPHAVLEHEDPFVPLSIEQHAVNTLCLLVEFGVTRGRVRAHRCVFAFSCCCAFIVFSWVQYPHTHIWQYFFLQLDPVAPLWYIFGGASAHILIYLAVSRLSAAKQRHLLRPPADAVAPLEQPIVEDAIAVR